MRNSPHRWALPPLPENAGWAERRWHVTAEIQVRGEIRWIRNEVCSGTHMIRRIVPSGVASFEPPRIGRISLGPPTTFTVELRPGQLIHDLLAIGDRLAAAYSVDDVKIHSVVVGWVRVVLVEREVGGGQSHRAPTRPEPPHTPTRPLERAHGESGSLRREPPVRWSTVEALVAGRAPLQLTATRSRWTARASALSSGRSAGRRRRAPGTRIWPPQRTDCSPHSTSTISTYGPRRSEQPRTTPPPPDYGCEHLIPRPRGPRGGWGRGSRARPRPAAASRRVPDRLDQVEARPRSPGRRAPRRRRVHTTEVSPQMSSR